MVVQMHRKPRAQGSILYIEKDSCDLCQLTQMQLHMGTSICLLGSNQTQACYPRNFPYTLAHLLPSTLQIFPGSPSMLRPPPSPLPGVKFLTPSTVQIWPSLNMTMKVLWPRYVKTFFFSSAVSYILWD